MRSPYLQDVASKSLSGLESLVHQIPGNVTSEGEQRQQVLQMHHQQAGVSSSYNHYPPSGSQASFSYPSASFGHYAPHYPAPNPYGHQGSYCYQLVMNVC